MYSGIRPTIQLLKISGVSRKHQGSKSLKLGPTLSAMIFPPPSAEENQGLELAIGRLSSKVTTPLTPVPLNTSKSQLSKTKKIEEDTPLEPTKMMSNMEIISRFTKIHLLPILSTKNKSKVQEPTLSDPKLPILQIV